MLTDDDRLNVAAAAVASAIADEGLSNAAFAARAGIDAGTLGDFLAAKRVPHRVTRAKIEGALGWQSGTIDRLIETGSLSPIRANNVELVDVTGLTFEQVGRVREVINAMRRAGDGPEMLRYENAETEISFRSNPAGRALDLRFGHVMGTDVSEPPARLRQVATEQPREDTDPPVGG